MKRYTPKNDGTSEVEENRGWLKTGRRKTGGRAKGTPNKIPGSLLEAVVEACALVGYDRDVYTFSKNAKGERVVKADESKRIKGLIPYLRRTAELHRKARSSTSALPPRLSRVRSVRR
jgi:hypothetical protein